jgi:hypothetical protein
MKLIGIFGLAGLAGFFFLCSSSRAESPVSLSVSPLFYDLQVNPGENKEGEIRVKNNSENRVDIKTEFSDFFIDDVGDYIFSEGKEIANENLKPFLMGSWLSADKADFGLEGGQSEVVKYRIEVPADANLGGHYGAIFFTTSCDQKKDENVAYTDKSNVCVSGRVGVLFLVQAGGEAVKKGIIKNVALPKISFDDKARMGIEIANLGNTHFKPQGEIVVKNIFGQEISRLEIKDRTLLPTTSRVFSEELQRKDFLGLYRVSGDIKDGDGHDMQFQKSFFLVPWKEILVVFGLIAAWIWFLKKFKISLRRGASK